MPAGISHWELGRFDLYRVNPPLVRLAAALPVLLVAHAEDWRSYTADPLVRGEGRVGIDFVAANGFRTFWLFTVARWACMPFALVGAWVCYRWALDLYGIGPGLTALTLWCTSPDILGHGALVMTDVPAAALGAAASYAFWRWLKEPSWPRALAAGLMLGMAELTKGTLLILLVLWPLAWGIYRWPGRRSMPWGCCLRQVGALAAMLAIALFLVNDGYLFEGFGRRLGDYRFQSHALTGLPAEDRTFAPGNRFAGTPLAWLPVPLPGNYVQGIDAQKLDFERGAPCYLGGRWTAPGPWYFYLYGLAVKQPLGTWILLVVASAMTLGPWVRPAPASRRDEMVILLLLAGVFAFVSSQAGTNIHYRYVIPSFPFLYIWASKPALTLDRDWWRVARRDSPRVACDSTPRAPAWTRTRRLLSAAVVLALAWSVCSSLRYYPHSLAYFNELAGGPENGHERLLDSSLDWGQDLLYLKQWYDAHAGARPLFVALHDSVDPVLEQTGMQIIRPPWRAVASGPGAPLACQHRPAPGWYAIDVYYLHDPSGSDFGSALAAPPGTDLLGVSFFRRLRPVARIGYTILIYHVGPGAEVSPLNGCSTMTRRPAGSGECPRPPSEPRTRATWALRQPGGRDRARPRSSAECGPR